MSNRSFLIILIFFFYLAPEVSGQEKPMESSSREVLKAGIKLAAQQTVTITSDFRQEKEISILNEKITSAGRFYFKAADRLRWEYTQPFSYTIVLNQNKISILDEGQVRSFDAGSNPLFQEVNNIMVGSVRGTLLDDEAFRAEYLSGTHGPSVRLTPLNAKLSESLKAIIIWFHPTDYTVDRLEMVEPSGDYTRIQFTRKQINQPIPDEVFVLE